MARALTGTLSGPPGEQELRRHGRDDSIRDVRPFAAKMFSVAVKLDGRDDMLLQRGCIRLADASLHRARRRNIKIWEDQVDASFPKIRDVEFANLDIGNFSHWHARVGAPSCLDYHPCLLFVSNEADAQS